MPSEGQKLKAMRLLNGNTRFCEVAKQTGWTPRMVRTFALKMGLRSRRSAAQAPRGEPMGVRVADVVEKRVTPSDMAIAERDRAYEAPRSLTAIVFGDPPPGRSALDKRHA